MLWRYLKSQAIVLLCGGLVGPIFLAVYFALQQNDLLKWMFYVGLLITAADVLIALAQITGITETGTRINGQPLVKLRLRIDGQGIAPFDSEDRVIAGVSRLGNITARKLVVLVDPATHEYQIDWERSALVNGLVPAQFTLAEDNKTYDLSGQAGPLMEIMQILKANHISLDRMVDVRSNPGLRQQIYAVVRRAGGAAESTSADRTAQRLEDLKTLHDSGALTDEEYVGKRAQVIAEI